MRCARHDYQLYSPPWAENCLTWKVLGKKDVWYCRHKRKCSKCGKEKPFPAKKCPDRPKDDGTIEFHDF